MDADNDYKKTTHLRRFLCYSGLMFTRIDADADHELSR
ncbi:hypothetical protein VPAL9027_03263 [Vibrio palustris]|uniref:Uncharacterized protein n=1 Tax=Vibrio palustris TaxID=1918946 RepID=A0A1R4B8I7_9VIBR|nr:hypothetical protein VPAL9027_03263 [Vibrio palustris]